jgi:hypothetical protein
LSSGFHGAGSGIEVTASCGVVTSTEWPMALRMLRAGAPGSCGQRGDGGCGPCESGCLCSRQISKVKPPPSLWLLLPRRSGCRYWFGSWWGAMGLGEILGLVTTAAATPFTLRRAAEVPSSPTPTPTTGESQKSTGLRGGSAMGTVPSLKAPSWCNGVVVKDTMLGGFLRGVCVVRYPSSCRSRFLRALWLLPSFPFSWRSTLKLCCAGVLAAAWRPRDMSFYVISICISPAQGETSPSVDGLVLFDPGQEGRNPLSAMEEEDACSRSPEAIHFPLPPVGLILC